MNNKEMGKSSYTYCWRGAEYGVLVGESEGKRLLGRHRSRLRIILKCISRKWRGIRT